MLTVFDDAGRRIGVKTRSQTHRDGDWHWLVFVWCAWLEDDQPVLLLQQRARPGDPFISNLDAPAGGHVAADESHRQAAVREFEEEVGLPLRDDDLVYLGDSPLENEAWKCRRVIQHFYLLPRRVDLRDVRFNEEVDGFVHVALAPLLSLLRGQCNEIAATARFAAAPDELRDAAVSSSAFDSYPDAIREVIVRSLEAIRYFLRENRVDAEIWRRP